jgi:hypothetical protein
VAVSLAVRRENGDRNGQWRHLATPLEHGSIVSSFSRAFVLDPLQPSFEAVYLYGASWAFCATTPITVASAGAGRICMTASCLSSMVSLASQGARPPT